MIVDEAMIVDEMTPLASADAQAFSAAHTLLTDVDDTLTSDGRLPAAAYAALEDLNAAGLKVIPVTGRPAGWCDMIARFWPVAGVVGENGALAYSYDRQSRKMRRLYEKTPAEHAADRAKLNAIAAEILHAVPGAAIAADQAFRIADLAIDFREDVAPLSEQAIARIVEIFQAHGATAKVSSIHVNGWLGRYDKLSMVKRLMSALASPLTDEGAVFVGDSPNDQPMFAAIPLSVGVANVRDFGARLQVKPRFVTQARGGAGFVELANFLLSARRQ